MLYNPSVKLAGALSGALSRTGLRTKTGRRRAVRALIPGANDWVQHAAGEYPAHFIPLVDGDETFYFVESCCYNKAFDADHVFVPVQHQDRTCSIYKVNIRDRTPGVDNSVLLQKVVKKDGETDISPFGTALSDDGVLWLCCFNESMVMAIDLNTGENLCEAAVPAPNDVCLSEDGKYAYAACGSWMGKLPVAAGKGTIWRINTSAPFTTKQVVKGAQGTMAGIAERAGKVWCAHLQRMTVYYRKGEDTLLGDGRTSKERIWTGYCSRDADAEKTDYYYLADNLTWWDYEKRDVLFTPCYRWLNGKLGELLDRVAVLSKLGWSFARVATTVKRLNKEGFSAVAKINDDGISPEVDLSFSKGDVFPHVHLCLYNIHTRATANHVFKIDCEKQGVDFDGHVTHVEHCGDGVLVLVNFQKKTLMVIDAKELVTPPLTPPEVEAKLQAKKEKTKTRRGETRVEVRDEMEC